VAVRVRVSGQLLNVTLDLSVDHGAGVAILQVHFRASREGESWYASGKPGARV
jgi:hypothetical protein